MVILNKKHWKWYDHHQEITISLILILFSVPLFVVIFLTGSIQWNLLLVSTVEKHFSNRYHMNTSQISKDHFDDFDNKLQKPFLKLIWEYFRIFPRRSFPKFIQKDVLFHLKKLRKTAYFYCVNELRRWKISRPPSSCLDRSSENKKWGGDLEDPPLN